jgi:hypothetical protein
MLVLPMGEIYKLRCSGGMVYKGRFMTISSVIQVILRLFTAIIREAAVLVLLMGGICEICR